MIIIILLLSLLSLMLLLLLLLLASSSLAVLSNILFLTKPFPNKRFLYFCLYSPVRPKQVDMLSRWRLVQSILGLGSMGNGSRTTSHQGQLPTGTTIPRTIPHQDNSPLGPLPRKKATHEDQYMYSGELSWWGVVKIRWKMCVIIAKSNRQRVKPMTSSKLFFSSSSFSEQV